ncbi:Uncharacterised protein [Candidatus Bilamarchaeum dharawalense]|uniref:Uncharacterized protein n=1 Tax=Candidatus Bilamarchaeum dharawalense TaxID=2885759 RepID=A0A5E4LQV9_9ARCH|nr:Uncharacterised protein [Candidatus Bilamarchaeum dharawalense]
MFAKTRKTRHKTKKLIGLASSLESDPSGVIHHMVALCNMLRNEDIELSTPEKMQVVKSMARAKVRAFMVGSADNYRTFKELDEISNDLVQLL